MRRWSIAVPTIAIGLVLLGASCDPEGATTYAITPGEAVVPTDQVWIEGRFGSGTRTIQLIDPSDPSAVLPTPQVVYEDAHSLRVSISSFSTTRKQYRIKVTIAGVSNVKVAGKSDRVFLRSSGSAPSSQSVRTQYFNWGWTFTCNQNACNCTETGLVPGWFYDPTWDDSWNGAVWADFRRFVDQTSRDWGTTCSDAWNEGNSLLSGISEAVPRETYHWNKHFWFNADPDSPEISGLARNRIALNLSGTFQEIDICTLVAGTCRSTASQPDRLRVHLVGAFVTDCMDPYADSEDRHCTIVDPTDPVEGFRGITPITSSYAPPGGGSSGNLPGFVVVSDLLITGQRPHPSDNGGCLGNLILPYGLTGWWGPSEGRDTTPNMLSHEFLHALTGLTHQGIPDTSIPDRVLVQESGDLRGFRMDIPAPLNQASTTEENCNRAVNGNNWGGGWITDFAQ